MDTGILWLIIVGVSAAVLYKVHRNQQAKAAAERESNQRKYLVAQIGQKAMAAYSRATEAKTATGQSNQAKRALGILTEADAYHECREVIRNYDEMCEHLEAMAKVAPVIDKVEKAYRHKFKGNSKAELGALLDALYEIRTEGITDNDIVNSRMYPSGTGEIVSIAGITARCKQLGWEG